jgi:CRP-like cAMP-binding protein
MELFKHLDKIYKISSDAKKAMEPLINITHYHKNDTVQEIGSRCKTIYIVKLGCARIFYFKDGNDITEHFAFENDMIVRAESLFTGKPTSKGIQTLEDTEMIAINSTQLFKLYDEHHDIERLFRMLFEREYVNSIKRLESLQFNSAKERYSELSKNKNLVQKIPLKHIASYLGITQVSLSRIRAEEQ